MWPLCGHLTVLGGLERAVLAAPRARVPRPRALCGLTSADVRGVLARKDPGPEDTLTLPAPSPWTANGAGSTPERPGAGSPLSPGHQPGRLLGHRVLATQSLTLVSTWARTAWGPVGGRVLGT